MNAASSRSPGIFTMTTAFEQAALYLGRQMRTRKQTEDYLRKKGFAADEIDEACDLLEEYRYLDDLEFARMYFESGYRKSKGRRRIRQELSAKGVSRGRIDEAETLVPQPDEEETALEIARQVLEGSGFSGAEDRKDKDRIRARAARRLASRGFQTDVIYRAIRRAETDKENEE